MDNFKEKILQITGSPCWGIVACDGNPLSLHFGKKILRVRTIKNEHLTHEEQKYEGEYGLFIKCAWRLDAEDKVLCGALSEHHEMFEELESLRGQIVRRVKLDFPAYDLHINFKSGHTLHIFCNIMEDEEYSNYTFFLRRIGWFSVDQTHSVSWENEEQQTVVEKKNYDPER